MKESDINVGLIRWEKNGIGADLGQLEAMPGNLTNPESFNIQFLSEYVEGANYRTIVTEPNPGTLDKMIKAAKQLKKRGAGFIVTSCGFNAIFNRELSDSVDIPVISSSLIQVPLVSLMIKSDQCIAIITADKKHLTKKHLLNAGIKDNIGYVIGGLDDSEEFQKINSDSAAELNVDKFTKEVLAIIEELITSCGNIGAVVMECTDLPPFSDAVRKKFHLPVFDIVTLVNMVYETVRR
jgi:aspartate/glutamate racemase